jgi:hypothetical protein
MQIVSTSTPSVLYATPREGTYTNVTLSIRDEATKQIDTSTVSMTVAGNYMQFSTPFQFIEGRSYNFEIKQGTSLLFRDKIFCTDQPTDGKYRIAQGQYESIESNNDYVINKQ